MIYIKHRPGPTRSTRRSSRVIYLALDSDWRVLVWPPALEIATGLAASEVIGRSCFDLWPWLLACRHVLEQAQAGQVVYFRERLYSNRETKVVAPYSATLRPGLFGGVSAILEVWPQRSERATGPA